MTSAGETQHVRIEIELVVRVTDPAAVRAAAIKHIEVNGTWSEGPDATSEERHAEIDGINADVAYAVQTLVDVDDVIDRIPGIEHGSMTLGTSAAASESLHGSM